MYFLPCGGTDTEHRVQRAVWLLHQATSDINVSYPWPAKDTAL